MKRRLLWIILSSMLIPPPGRWIGVCVTVCVLALFFFPLAQGSFQATHGPITAFRARRLIFGIIHSLVRKFLVALARVLRAGSLQRLGLAWRRLGPPSFAHAAPSMAILRC
ncbi:MAG TPA: hypothetical protein VF532_22735 [Candidatus Angelobacter sp.]